MAMLTVTIPEDHWDAIVSAAKAYHEIVSQDGEPEGHDDLAMLGEALDRLDDGCNPALPESPR